MKLEYVKHKKIDLRSHPDFSEVWLHDLISEDASILGLGNLELIQREKIQYSGGRLDLLLSDGDSTRFEVEVMLGPTDPSHIIRCIEYWDIERRRYPAYDHIAVLVAEEITNRFLNVMSLFAGSIPFIAIQLNALQIESRVVLDFVNVLDQRALREDDSIDQGGEEVTREAWEQKIGNDPLRVCDTILSVANEISEISFELKYKKRHVAVTEAKTFRNLFSLLMRKNFVIVARAISDAEEWKLRFEEAGVSADTRKGGTRLRIVTTVNDLHENESLFREYIKQSVMEYQS